MMDNTNVTTTAGTELTNSEDQKTFAERFTSMVMKQYSSTGSLYDFTEREKQLIRNYFISIDQMLQKTEADRLRKNQSNRDHEKYDNKLPYTWNTLDLPQLAQDLAHYARVGLDMMEDNTLFPIPYKNSKGNKYTITLMEGYNGIRYQAEKYALTPFNSVTVEVIYSNDKFRAIKRDRRNPVEGYEFDIINPFDRGEPIGVFGYIEFEDKSKNKLVVFSKADVEKRKPKYASPEFWGGEKTVYDNGRPVKVMLEGWVPEMYEKTMKREIYGSKHIPRDPDKIDASYHYIQQRERDFVDIAVESEVAEKGNSEPLTLPKTPETIELNQNQAVVVEPDVPIVPEQPEMPMEPDF